MPVNRTTRECYEVREDNRAGEWANITLSCWSRRTRSDTYYCGEITIHSSFGTWGNTWTACAVPFKRFLIGVDFDYVFGKFMGAARDRFDGKASAAEVSRRIIDARRRDGLPKFETRELWGIFEFFRGAAELSEHEFGTAMQEVAREIGSGHPLHDYFADPTAWPHRTRYDAQAQGFWRQLWPLFVDALKEEVGVAA